MLALHGYTSSFTFRQISSSSMKEVCSSISFYHSAVMSNVPVISSADEIFFDFAWDHVLIGALNSLTTLVCIYVGKSILPSI